MSDKELYRLYQAEGGTLSLAAWIQAGRPPEGGMVAGDQPDEPRDPRKPFEPPEEPPPPPPPPPGRDEQQLTFEQWLARFHPEIDILTLGQGIPTQRLVAEFERFLAGDESQFTPDPQTFEEWMAQVHPDVDISSLGIEGLRAFQDEWRLGPGTGDVDPDLPPPGDDDGPITPPPIPDEPLVEGDDDFQQSIADAIAAAQAQQEEFTAARIAESQRLSARNIGKLSTAQRNALLARGVSEQDIGQLLLGGQEQGARSLRDLEAELGLQGQQALAQSSQFAVGAQLSAEGLENVQRQLAQQQGQFQQGLAESVRQFGLSQSQQQGQFTAGLGFSQQQLAQQQQQFGSTQRQQRRQANPFSSFGNFFNTLSGSVGATFDLNPTT